MSGFPTCLTEETTPHRLSDMPTTKPQKPTTIKQVEDLILALLAEREGVTPGALRTQLEKGGGANLPVDSLKTVAIVVQLEEQLGIQLPNDKETGNALRSVRRLADLIVKLVSDIPEGGG